MEKEKIIKNNSIIFNQLWIDKIIEEGHIELLPYKKPDGNLSIGEYLEQEYENLDENSNKNNIKITKKNSILFLREWVSKYIEEGIYIPKYYKYEQNSIGELLEQRYIKREMIKGFKELEKNKCLELK